MRDDFDEYFIQSNFPARRLEDLEHTPQFHLELPSEGDLREMLKFISFILRSYFNVKDLSIECNNN